MLNTGENVTTENIAPIFFVGKENREKNLIIKHLEKHVSKKMRSQSITRTQFLNYFIAEEDKKELDKQKILNLIEEILDNLSLKEKMQLERYCSTKKSQKSLLQQLIINQLTLWQLDHDPETKSIFEKVKNKWTEVASWDSSQSKFTINQDKFNQILKEEPSSRVLDLTNDTSLLISEKMNQTLLQDALIAYVFGLHQINKTPLQVDVSMKEQVESNFIWRFLKKNLNDTHRINYGINYDITDDVLNFSGITKDYLQGRTLVIQIATTRNRILKEIRIHGTSESTIHNKKITHDLLNENNYEVY